MVGQQADDAAGVAVGARVGRDLAGWLVLADE
jgi:hypothetical protein